MTKCKKCNHDCHCNGDLHADEYGLCVCEDCQCKREYVKEKDYGTDMSYENEVRYDGQIYELLCHRIFDHNASDISSLCKTS